MLKKIVLIVAIVLSLLISCLKVAYADTVQWARITTDNVRLYATPDTKQELFKLAKSYYVNVIGETDGMYQVAVMPEGNAEFVQIIGFVRKSDVTVVTQPPIEPIYPTEKLTVTVDSVELKLSPVPSAETLCAVLNLQQVCYYGQISSYGSTWYYVRYANRFGYIEASALTEPNIELHPTPLPGTPAATTPTTPSTPNTDPADPKASSPTSEILLIVFVVVLGVGLTLALFLPGNVKKKSSVFEQDI